MANRTLIGRLYDQENDLCTEAANKIGELKTKLARVEKLPRQLRELVIQEDNHPKPGRPWAKGKKTGLRTAIIYILAAMEQDDE